MADQQDNQSSQLQFFLTDLGTRIKDLEEKTSSMKERLNLVSQNLIESREGNQDKILKIERQTNQLTLEVKKLGTILQSISSEMNNFARKDEIVLVERMLKDFQPLEFMRKGDVEELLKEKSEQKIEETPRRYPNNSRVNETKEIKTTKPLQTNG